MQMSSDDYEVHMRNMRAEAVRLLLVREFGVCAVDVSNERLDGLLSDAGRNWPGNDSGAIKHRIDEIRKVLREENCLC